MLFLSGGPDYTGVHKYRMTGGHSIIFSQAGLYGACPRSHTKGNIHTFRDDGWALEFQAPTHSINKKLRGSTTKCNPRRMTCKQTRTYRHTYVLTDTHTHLQTHKRTYSHEHAYRHIDSKLCNLTNTLEHALLNFVVLMSV